MNLYKGCLYILSPTPGGVGVGPVFFELKFHGVLGPCLDFMDFDDVRGKGKYLGGVRRVVNMLMKGKKVPM